MKVKHLRKFLETIDQEKHLEVEGHDCFLDIVFASTTYNCVTLCCYEPQKFELKNPDYREIPQDD